MRNGLKAGIERRFWKLNAANPSGPQAPLVESYSICFALFRQNGRICRLAFVSTDDFSKLVRYLTGLHLTNLSE